MKKIVLATASAFALAALATSASAAISVITPIVADDLHGSTLAPGLVMLENFDTVSNGNVDYVGNVVLDTPDPITNSAPPPWSGGVPVGGAAVPVDPTPYASVQAGTSATFTRLHGGYFTAFSFYMGSPDTYNTVTFNLLGGGVETFEGAAIWGGDPPGNGDRSAGYRVTYNFGGAKVSSITFSSSQDAFEFDGLAGAVNVPEPSTWAMMLLGFGAAGSILRSRRRPVAA